MKTTVKARKICGFDDPITWAEYLVYKQGNEYSVYDVYDKTTTPFSKWSDVTDWAYKNIEEVSIEKKYWNYTIGE